jgi:hypothetical protein
MVNVGEVELYAPQGYEENRKESDCDGCGTGWNEKLVPDTIYFLNIKPSCCVHDYMYLYGEPTKEGKELADRVFLNNMLRQIEAVKKWYYPKALARRRAMKYYLAVKHFGGTAYWKGKN